MLTTIGANGVKGDAVSKSSSGRSSPARTSTENIIRVNDKASVYGGMGGIEVTTKVDVSESQEPRDVFGDRMRQIRSEAKHMV